MADREGTGKFSLGSFWKWSKQALSKTTSPMSPKFPVDKNSQSSTTVIEGKATNEAKANRRRQQVRQAQINHRQRKAYLVRQLEFAVAQLREKIDATVREATALEAQNDAMRRQLEACSPAGLQELHFPAHFGTTSFDEPGMSLTLRLDEATRTHCFQISSAPPPSSFGTSRLEWNNHDDQSSIYSLISNLSPEQIHQAIDFVLALESPCWSHFRYSDFHLSSPLTEPEMGSGHTLMASSLALRSAPESVFNAIVDQISHLAESRPQESRQAPDASHVCWQTSSLTLQSLYGLACSLTSLDVEVTPVQALFELFKQVPLVLLLSPNIYEVLKIELLRVVKCQTYGAVIERGAFDDIVQRVLSPAVI